MQQKQRLAIQRLQIENNKLKDEILLDNKCNPSGHGYATSIQIAKLQDQADLYTRKVRKHVCFNKTLALPAPTTGECSHDLHPF